MKICKISFKNIHSLRGEHHIDFVQGPLAVAGLFAITGATGAGKSTLLDVITLALYNRIPRMDGTISKSVIDGEGGIMTRNSQDCYAEVEYRVNGKTYRSHWSIERNRNNNLNDRKQEIIDVATGAIIESGKSSVPARNEELIGLKYDQFVKAMVLSQGQFSKLLQAKRDERNKLLEDITGAKDYRAIGMAVYRKYKEALDACKEHHIKLGEIERIPEEERQELVSKAVLLTELNLSKRKALNQLKTEIEHQKGISKNEALLTKNDLQQKELSEEVKGFGKQAALLEKHEKYVKHTSLISDFEQKQKEFLETSTDLENQKTNSSRLETEKAELIKTVSDITKSEIAEQDFISKLTHFRKQVNLLMDEEKAAAIQSKGFETNLKNVLLEINKGQERVPFNPQPDLFMKGISPSENRIDQFLGASKIGNETDIAHQETALKSRSKILAELKLIVAQYVSETENYSQKIKDFSAVSENASKYQKTLQDLETELDKLQKEVDGLVIKEDNRKKHQSLEEQRALLTDGEPCPLCGALDHPYALENPVFDYEAEMLKTKSDLLHSRRDLKSATLANLKNAQDAIKSLQPQVDALKKQIDSKLEKIESLSNQLQIKEVKNNAVINEEEEKIDKDLQQLEKVKKAFLLKSLFSKLTETAHQWQTFFALKEEKRQARQQLYKEEDIDTRTQSLISKWTANTENIKNNRNLISQLDKKLKSIIGQKEHFENQLNQLLQSEGIENIAQLKALILSEDRAQQIRKQEIDLRLKQERLKTERANAQSQIAELKKLIFSSEPLAVLEANYIKEEDDYNRTTKEVITINNRLETDAKTKEKQDLLLSQLKDLKKEEDLWKTMNGLIGDANGKRFSNFVQDLTLEQLIGYTNLRLKDLTDRYILDIPTADEADKNDSLKVFDVHQGDARRSINTLSGGETFMVSLAMAFALSDLAAKNVKIESIFIDEGFGTLDPETLNQAITILEKMQNEGDKSIGVISHVEALKERISTQIRLEKTGSGYSTVTIVD